MTFGGGGVPLHLTYTSLVALYCIYVLFVQYSVGNTLEINQTVMKIKLSNTLLRHILLVIYCEVIAVHM